MKVAALLLGSTAALLSLIQYPPQPSFRRRLFLHTCQNVAPAYNVREAEYRCSKTDAKSAPILMSALCLHEKRLCSFSYAVTVFSWRNPANAEDLYLQRCLVVNSFWGSCCCGSEARCANMRGVFRLFHGVSLIFAFACDQPTAWSHSDDAQSTGFHSPMNLLVVSALSFSFFLPVFAKTKVFG